MQAQDIDQEVKERAISCMGQIVAHLGDSLQQQLGSCLPIFLDRLKNEITRLTAVKALILVASSPLKIDLRCILIESLPVLSSFLRKNQRALKLSSSCRTPSSRTTAPTSPWTTWRPCWPSCRRSCPRATSTSRS